MNTNPSERVPTVCLRTVMVIPTLGRHEGWFHEAVASVTQQTRPVQLLVVGPSTSPARLWCAHLGLRYLDFEGGLTAAINYGFDQAPPGVEFAGWLGDDDVLAPGAIAAAEVRLMDQVDAPYVYGRLRYIDGSGSTLWVARPSRWAPRYLRLGKNFVPQPGSLLRRSSLAVISGLDESLHNCMDQDLFTRLGRTGLPCYLPRELAAFRVHQASITSRKGAGDESELVRMRQWDRRSRALYRTVRPLTRQVDRVLHALMRRTPAGPPALLHGRDYCRPAPRTD